MTRRNNSVNGNPVWDVTLQAVTSHEWVHVTRTQSDASIGYSIDNAEFRDTDVMVSFSRAGRIVDIKLPERVTYRVYRADGTEVLPGDAMPKAHGDHESDLFHGCTHPRKVTVKVPCDEYWARDGYTVREYYPSVYNVEIRSSNGRVWDPVSEVGKTLPINMEG